MAVEVTIFAEPKIDCHVHVLDPVRFPYRVDTHYAPRGQELGTPAQLAQVMQAYGTQHALLVGPNSGYGLDNSCMLDTMMRSPGLYKGIAVVPNDITVQSLQSLKDQGVVGVAWNVTYYGLDHYRDAAPLLQHLAALDMFVDIQVEHEQLVEMMPLLMRSGVRILSITAADRRSRPGSTSPDFARCLRSARRGARSSSSRGS
jgi:predicted TIM-barrel fold metal-dependent hydrolase